MIERLRRDPTIELDPHVLNAAFVLDPTQRERLARCYRDYLRIGETYNLPMICCTPTWRANAERSSRAGYSCGELNARAVSFLRAIRDEYGEYSKKVFVGGLMGCRGDAYSGIEGMGPADAEAFHGDQARALAAAGVDFLVAVTMPSAPESIGMAAALSACGLPYFLSFIVRPSGKLLDTTLLHDIVAVIDNAAKPRPLGYWINCVHPTVFSAALGSAIAAAPWLPQRVYGLQANTSALSPEELDESPQLHSQAPEAFVAAMMQAQSAFGTKILGGCCGTSPAHIERLAAAVAARC